MTENQQKSKQLLEQYKKLFENVAQTGDYFAKHISYKTHGLIGNLLSLKVQAKVIKSVLDGTHPVIKSDERLGHLNQRFEFELKVAKDNIDEILSKQNQNSDENTK